MAQTLDTREDGFAARFETLLGMKRESSSDVNDAVSAIIADVRARGDEALIELTQKFDHLDLREAGLAVSESDIAVAHSAVDDETVEALRFAHQRVLDHHKRQLPESETYFDALGVELLGFLDPLLDLFQPGLHQLLSGSGLVALPPRGGFQGRAALSNCIIPVPSLDQLQ